ncbi:MAG: ribosome small subunit-dependent GTPase A [Corynebacteriales bacterium]|nr:ribosome small subunit-dependent GTPase A [Mycobacteriales bacterium]
MSHSHFASSPVLSGLGWDESFEQNFAAHRAHGRVPARVIQVHRQACDVIGELGQARLKTPKGSALCTGDWVAVRWADEPEIVELVSRRTAITRAAVGGSSESQALAANVDTVVIAVSLAMALRPARIERLLAVAWESGARPVIALTKADLAENIAAIQAEVSALAPGVDVVATSANTGEGVDIFTALISGTTVLLGPSGAGKSSLGNALLGTNALETGAVRQQDGKGRHTTVRRELLVVPSGGVLIDTPGLRGIGLTGGAESVEQVFADIETYGANCHFRDCAHHNEPGCGVLEAIELGVMPRRRLDSYRKLLRESEWQAARSDARLRAKGTERIRRITKDQRAMYKFRARQEG